MIWILFFLTSCSGISPEQRRENVAQLANSAGFSQSILVAGEFGLAAFANSALDQADEIHIYLEGDGFAWIDSSTPSFDPTPTDPIGFKLALNDLSGKSVYLGRPCQYVRSSNCSNIYWTTHRFSPEVIAAVDIAVEQLKRRYQAKRIILIGYSGGAAVAALVAARRKDIAALLTVAGNLDHVVWAKRHKLSPLTGSLNPADAWRELSRLPQTHWVGTEDKIVEKEVAFSYRARFQNEQKPDVVVVPGFNHHCCWDENWATLLDRAGIGSEQVNRGLPQ